MSAAIQSLEADCGVRLFDRVGRRIEITQAGCLLKTEAQKILDQVRLAKRGLQAFDQLQRGELNLGVSQTIGNYWLPCYLSEFKRQYAGIEVNYTLGNTEAIAAKTASGEFDLGLVEGDIEPDLERQLIQRVIGYDRLLIVVGRSHPWFERSQIAPEDLSQTDWIVREAGSGTRQIFEQALQRWEIAPDKLNLILSLVSGEMVKAIVETGIGATAISELMVEKELRFGLLKALPIQRLHQGASELNKKQPGADQAMQRPFILLKHQDRFQTRIAQVFEQMLESSYQSL